MSVVSRALPSWEDLRRRHGSIGVGSHKVTSYRRAAKHSHDPHKALVRHFRDGGEFLDSTQVDYILGAVVSQQHSLSVCGHDLCQCMIG